MTFTEKKFQIPELIGISTKTIEEHLKLYSGYVKNANLILEKINEARATEESISKNTYSVSEMQRRFSFEFNGIKNHEYYFEQFENGANAINTDGKLFQKISETFESFDLWMIRFKEIAMTRGVGWAILYLDKKTNSLIQTWIDEQHIGHLADTQIILALDMWEHSYMLDCTPSEKKNYIEYFFQNLNWNVVEGRLG